MNIFLKLLAFFAPFGAIGSAITLFKRNYSNDHQVSLSSNGNNSTQGSQISDGVKDVDVKRQPSTSLLPQSTEDSIKNVGKGSANKNEGKEEPAKVSTVTSSKTVKKT